jgi:hypothetical protein
VLALVVWAGALPAHALDRGDLRLSIDFPALVFGNRTYENDGGGEFEVSTIGFGNLHEQSAPMLGFSYALSDRLLVGGRAGFGFHKSEDDDGDKVKSKRLLLNPLVTFVPTAVGSRSKLFVEGGPLLSYQTTDFGADESSVLLGGIGLAAGLMIFAADAVSVDLAAFFEGSWGSLEDEDDTEVDIQNLVGGLRVGLSLWL